MKETWRKFKKSLARTKGTNLLAKAGEKMNMKIVTRGLRHLDCRISDFDDETN